MEPTVSTEATSALPPAPPADLSRIRELMNRAWAFYKGNFRRLWLLFILGGMAETSIRISFNDQTRQVLNSPEVIDLDLAVIALLVLAAVAIILFLALSSIALMRSIVDVRNNDYQGLRSAYKKSLPLFGPYLLIAVVANMAILGGYFALIIPGIALVVYLSFSYLVFVDQNKRGLAALTGSWELVSGKWWRTLGRFIVFLLAVGGIMLLTTIATMLIAFFFGFVLSAKSGVAIAIIVISVALFATVTYLFAIPLGILFMVELYYDLKRVHEQSMPTHEKVTPRRRKLLIASAVFGAILISLSIFFALKVLPTILARIEGWSGPVVYIPERGELEYENRDFNLSVYYPSDWRAAESVSEGVKGTPGALDVSFWRPAEGISSEALQISTSYIGYVPNETEEENMRKDITEIGVNYLTSELLRVMPADEAPVVAFVASSTSPLAGVFAVKSEHTITHQDKTFRAWIAGFYVHDRGYVVVYFCEKRECKPERFDTFLRGLNPFYDHESSGSNYRYRNSEYGFEMSYPKDLFFTTAPRAEGFAAVLARSLIDTSTSLSISVEVLQHSVDTLNIEKMIEDHREELIATENVSQVTGGRVEREGVEAAAAFDFMYQLSPRKMLIILKDGMLYRLFGSFQNDDEIPVFDRVAASFKLIARSDAASASSRSTVGDYGISLTLSPTEVLGHFDNTHPLYKETIHVVWMEPSSDADTFHPRIYFVIPFLSPSSKPYLSRAFWNETYFSYESKDGQSSESLTFGGYPAECRRYLTKSVSGTDLINATCLIVKGDMVRAFTFADDATDFPWKWPRAKAILDSIELR